MLQDGSYSILPRDPTSRIEREITTLLRSGDFLTDVFKRLIPRNCKPPRIYGLPKIHKNNCPLRSIVSTLESPTYNTAQYLGRVLKEYTGKTSSHILLSSHFVQLISEIFFDPEDRIVSLLGLSRNVVQDLAESWEVEGEYGINLTILIE